MTQYLDWHVGMKVVCLDIAWPAHAASIAAKGCRFPELGRIYTIREIGVAQEDGKVYVRLREIVNPRVNLRPWPAGEPRFGARRFRPVQTRKTDISCFQQMLAPSKVKERETA